MFFKSFLEYLECKIWFWVVGLSRKDQQFKFGVINILKQFSFTFNNMLVYVTFINVKYP